MALRQSLQEVGVSRLVHQGAQFAPICELDAKEPAPTERILVDEAWRRLNLGINGKDFAGSWRKHVARRLDALDHRGGITFFQCLADRRRLSKDYVAQLLLRVIADANDAFAALDADVFVVLAVADLRHHASPCSTAIIGVGMKRQRDDTRAQALAAHHQIDRRSDRRVGARDIAHRDRTVDAWPEPAGCHDADRQPFGRNYFGSFARRRTAVWPHAYALTIRAVRECVLDPLGPGKAALDASALLNRPGESGFDRVYRLIEFMLVKAKARLEP